LESIRHAPWARWIRPERITTFAHPSFSEEARQRWRACKTDGAA
jgi:hypothetical protein